ncbi:MAG TPA: alpha/beta hydrolase [Casimicrobiaceae bacterium]|nr:alpha/beta hydrolase [Casimicrobiaceae bacterium]
MPFAPIASGELFYEVAGSGPPVVLAAGLAGLGKFWDAEVAILAKRFMVITYDHRGAGRSTHSPPPYSVEGMMQDVLALLDHLRLARVHLVGHSTGGAIGQLVAARFPARISRLVLSATWSHADPYFRRLFTLRRELLERGAGDLYARLSTLLLYSSDWIAEHDTELDDAATTNARDIAIMASKIDALLDFDGRAALPAISCPTLVITARDDATIPPRLGRELAKRLPNATLTLLESGGHYFPITRAREFTDAVRQFLDNKDRVSQ